jgi:hypothetical protein
VHDLEVEHRVDEAAAQTRGRVPRGNVNAELDVGRGGTNVGIRDVVMTGVDADVVQAVVGGDVSREGVLVGVRLGCVHRFSRCAAIDI